MISDAYRALPGITPEEKLAPFGITAGLQVDLRRLAEVSREYGITAYLFFDEALARNNPVEMVIHRYREVQEDMRPYVRIEAFLHFIEENDPSFLQVMDAHPVMVTIIKTGQIAADPNIPPLVYITGLMPFADEFRM